MKKDIIETDIKYTTYKYAMVFLLIIVFINSANYIFQNLSDGYYPEITQTIIAEVIAACLLFALIPSIYFFSTKYPISKPNLYKNLFIHFIFSLFISTFMTSMMYTVRSLLWPAFGFGKYEYGILKYRIAMEYFRVLLIYAILYGGIHWLKSLIENQRQKLQASKLEEQLAKSKIETLQMQLNPHFLFNTLNVISSTMYDDVNAADKMIADLSSLLRMALNKKNEMEHPLYKEIELLQLYSDIMKARFKDKMNLEIDYDKKLTNCLVPVFILQPLVENSIRYSTESLKEIGVRILIFKENEHLVLSVKDSGPGMSELTNDRKGLGLGLSNTSSRLQNLYGNSHTLTWYNLIDGGFEVKIIIPYREV